MWSINLYETKMSGMLKINIYLLYYIFYSFNLHMTYHQQEEH